MDGSIERRFPMKADLECNNNLRTWRSLRWWYTSYRLGTRSYTETARRAELLARILAFHSRCGAIPLGFAVANKIPEANFAAPMVSATLWLKFWRNDLYWRFRCYYCYCCCCYGYYRSAIMGTILVCAPQWNPWMACSKRALKSLESSLELDR
jgi:hypothetical protein